MILESLATRLEAQGVATRAVNLYLGILPETPDAVIGIFEYAGSPPVEVFDDSGASLDVPSVQVMVRAGRNDYVAGRNKMVAVRNALVDIANETIDGLRILRVAQLSSINALGMDKNDRPVFTMSLQATVER